MAKRKKAGALSKTEAALQHQIAELEEELSHLRELLDDVRRRKSEAKSEQRTGTHWLEQLSSRPTTRAMVLEYVKHQQLQRKAICNYVQLMSDLRKVIWTKSANPGSVISATVSQLKKSGELVEENGELRLGTKEEEEAE